MNQETEMRIAIARRAAAFLLERPTQYAAARDWRGNKIDALSDHARFFDPFGAITRAAAELGCTDGRLALSVVSGAAIDHVFPFPSTARARLRVFARWLEGAAA